MFRRKLVHKLDQGNYAIEWHRIIKLARMPPTMRWPLGQRVQLFGLL